MLWSQCSPNAATTRRNTVQQKAFEEVKNAPMTAPVLILYDPSREMTVSADTSCYGLGAVLMQRQLEGTMKLVAYISHSLTPTEQKYAQIEKEALAFTWACECFSDYLVELQFHIETDHKPTFSLVQYKEPG